ncbi:MAG: trypsin-like peptidase domain-containing protein [Deltaproteobacteria bacterium]|nr:trypsin-like peptidase domain-containing protein [Deltaproteobacteria bacterium]
MSTTKFQNIFFSSTLCAAVLLSGYELGHLNTFSSGAAVAAPIAPPIQPPVAAPVGDVFVTVADRAMPSVVNIFTTKNVRRFRPRGYDFWQHYFDGFGEQGDDGEEGFDPSAGRFQGDRVARPMSLGTGFVIEADSKGGGLILTNNHVVSGADEVKVKLTEDEGERELHAEVIGRDPVLDVALLRVEAKRPLTPIPLGDSDALRVGQWIAALGNPFGHGHSLSHGIVSAKARALPGGFGKYLQVDAPINPGNSGGPLVNLAGEVVGINNAIDARGPGIGFAIPIDAVKAVLPQLKKSGKVERGYLGIGLAARPADGAPMVAEVMPGAPAAEAGLKPRDVIVSLDGARVRNPDELVAVVTRTPVGQRLKAEVERDGKTRTIELRVARRPAQS